MSFKNSKKWLISSIVGVTCLGVATTTFTSFNTQIRNKNNIEQQNQSAVNPRDTQDKIEVSFGDIVNHYNNGYNREMFRSIIVAESLTDGTDKPDLSKKLIEIRLEENTLRISNTYTENPGLWNRLNYSTKGGLNTPINRETPWVEPTSNYIKITQFEAGAGMDGTNSITWDSAHTDPSAIKGTINLTDTNNVNFCLNIVNNSATNFSLFIDRNLAGTPSWTKIDNDVNFGCATSIAGSSNIISMEGIIQKDLDSSAGNQAKGKLYIPQVGNSEIGKNDWTSLPASANDVATKYKKMPCDLAFKEITKNKADLKYLVKFNPKLCVNSMSGFKATVTKDAANNRWTVQYGVTPTDTSNLNNYFKFGMYATPTPKNNRRIYPFYFDTTSLASGESSAGQYLNISANFNSMADNHNVISGFNDGTYYEEGEYSINRKQYASNVDLNEIKREILSKVRNAPTGFGEADIILDPNNPVCGIEINNTEGYIRFKVIVTKFKNNAGEIVTNNAGENIAGIQYIRGFNTIKPTAIRQTRFTVSDHTMLASKFGTNEILNLVLDNKRRIFSTLTEDVKPTEVLKLADIRIVGSPKIFNRPEGEYTSGRIECQIQLLTGYLTSPNALPAPPNTPMTEFKLVIDGFKVVTNTIFHENVKLVGYSNELATKYATRENFMKLYEKNKTSFVENLPTTEAPTILKGPTANNKGKDTIDNGQSGYISVQLSFPSIYDADGNIQYNITQTFIIYGFKKVIPTVIEPQPDVNKPNTLATEVIKGTTEQKEQAMKQLIVNNQTAFFKRSSLPDNFQDNMTVNVIEVRNLKDWQIKAKIVLKTYYDNDGLLVEPSGDPNKWKTVDVLVRGFKEVSPTTLESGTVAVIDGNKDKYAYQVADKNYENLKKIIMNINNTSLSKPIINGDLPDGFKMDDIVIAENPIPEVPGSNAPSINNIQGQISFTCYLKKWYQADGGLASCPPDGSYISGAPVANITLTGFQVARPTTDNIRSKFTIPQDNPAYKRLPDTNVSFVVQLLNKDPSMLDANEKEILTEFKRFLYDSVFDGFKLPFDPDKSIEISPATGTEFIYKSLDGSLLDVNIKIHGYMDEEGIIHDGPNDYYVTRSKKSIYGFKKIIPTTVSTKYQDTRKPFQAPSDFTGFTPNYILQYGELARVIEAHDKDKAVDPADRIILGDIPPQFLWSFEKGGNRDTGSLVLVGEPKVDNEASTITFNLKLNCFYTPGLGMLNDPSEYSDAAEIQIAGFKAIPSTTINKVVVTDKFIYPTTTNPFRRPLDVNIQEYSDARFKTADSFFQSIQPNTTDTSKIAEAVLRQTVFYSDIYNQNSRVNQPLVIYNPETTNKMNVRALYIDNVNNDAGTILLTAVVEGFYYSKSTTPTPIISDKKQSFACIDINLKGFVSNAAYQASHDKPIVIVPILAVSIVFVVFLITLFIRLGVHRSKKPTRDKDLFFED